jgi:hypothetical protein
MKITDSRATADRDERERVEGRTQTRSRWQRVLWGYLAIWAMWSGLVSHGFAAVLPTNVTLYAAAFGSGTFVSVGANGAIFSSTNGGPWEQRVSSTTNRLESVAFGGGLFLAAADNGTLLSSPDGVTWTIRSITATQSMPQVAYGNGQFVVAGKGGAGRWTMLVSSNAINWTTVNIEAPGPASAPDGMPLGAFAFGAGKFIAAGGTPGGAKLFLSSTDGLTWKEQGAEGTSTSSTRYGPMIYGDGAFAVIENYYDVDDDDSGFYDRLLISHDGDFWGFGNFFVNFDWKAVAAGDCRFVLAANSPSGGNIYSASRNDPYNWQIVTAPTINVVNALAYGAGRFFAFGSDIVELSLLPVPSLIQVVPTNQTAEARENVYVSFSASSSCLPPPVFYQWRRNGLNIPDATNQNLFLQSVTTSDAGQYTIVASNALGQIETSAPAQLTVQAPANAPASVGYPTAPYTNNVPVGNDISFGAYVSGWPKPSYQWRFNGVNLPGATNEYLWLFNVGPSAEGAYTLFVSNAFGTASSAPIGLTLIENAPSYLTSTQSYSVREDARFAFLQPYEYLFYTYWLAQTELHVFKNNVPFRLPLVADPTVGLNVVINRTSLSDAGVYSFVVSNAFGMATARVANVSVIPAEPVDRWKRRNPLPQNESLFDAAHGNDVFVAVGERGTIVSSTNGTDWSASQTTGETILSGVAFGNGVFVAAGGANIFSSIDGQNWVLRVARFDLFLQSVIFANGRFVAVGGNNIVTSTDGVTWSDATAPVGGNREFRHVAFGNGTFVIVGDGRNGPGIWISANGTSWSPVMSAPQDELEGITFDNGQFVAVGDDGALYTSPDATSWTARNSTIGSRLLGVAHGAGRFVVVGARGRILSSGNGISWTRETSGTPDRLESVRFLNNLFVAVGENGTTLTSQNGSTWTKRSQGSTRDLDGMTQGGGLIVVVGKGGTIMTSSNGTHFIQQNSGVTNDLHGVGFANGLFVAVGEPEIIITSSNAVQWETRHSGGTSSLKSVRHGDNSWVAVGTEGVILTSWDGVTWTLRTSTTCNDLNDVVFANGLYVVVGDNLPPNGTMLVSGDGITWTRRPQFIGKNLRSVNYVNNTFIATANDETFIVSSNASQWELRTTGLYTGFGVNLRAATFAAGTWVLVGNTGTVLTSSNAMDWTRRSTPTVENLHGVAFFNDRFVVMGNRGTILQSGSLASQPTLAGRFTGGGFEITVMGRAGTFYELQSASALVPQQWNPFRAFTLQQATTNILDSRSVSNAQQFYRVISP